MICPYVWVILFYLTHLFIHSPAIYYCFCIFYIIFLFSISISAWSSWCWLPHVELACTPEHLHSLSAPPHLPSSSLLTLSIGGVQPPTSYSLVLALLFIYNLSFSNMENYAIFKTLFCKWSDHHLRHTCLLQMMNIEITPIWRLVFPRTWVFNRASFAFVLRNITLIF